MKEKYKKGRVTKNLHILLSNPQAQKLALFLKVHFLLQKMKLAKTEVL